jgi:hypothetical protein
MAGKKTITVDEELLAKDLNGDGHLSKFEYDMEMEFKRKRLEDEDAMRDSQRKMAWFALFGMLLYPACVLVATYFNMDSGAGVLGDMAPTYFVSVAAIVAAFYGKTAFETANKSDD